MLLLTLSADCCVAGQNHQKVPDRQAAGVCQCPYGLPSNGYGACMGGTAGFGAGVQYYQLDAIGFHAPHVLSYLFPLLFGNLSGSCAGCPLVP